MKEISNVIAANLLKIKAVSLNSKEPFKWASGIYSPIYTDNRLTVSYPNVRKNIAEGFAKKIHEKFLNVDVIAGVATAGIPHAAWVAEKLNLPLIYVRSKPKEHGTKSQIEGVLKEGSQVILIDDLFSTGGSVLKAVKAVRKAGGNILAVGSIFSYQLPQATNNFELYNVSSFSLTNYFDLIKIALRKNYIDHYDFELLYSWHQNPIDWSKKYKQR